jgi:transcriptional regulator with XRE-family HTH domain
MSYFLSSYLHTLRKQRGLSQSDLAALLGISVSALSRIERRTRRPTAELMVATEMIFGERAEKMFPGFYREIEREVAERAQARLELLKVKPSRKSRHQLDLLSETIKRANKSDPQP